ncbi:SDR family NAD(P)-dependent oxidoreductase [Lichenibacterium ramalinae]|uniref:SDR family NAD(P)-dependent oxidoreductase n=1 Tax=Lichenibacterium ramalinae TaxID=2316527 RepID=A0A4Q2R7R6_9HYPH|nr:SDR family NAD(P)-dependent oxidoreductase [Lichenibacterium ramalinae]
MARPIAGTTVVVVGASSGIGRAAALAFAQAGADVVVAARRGDLLDEVVRGCEAAGARALAVPTDVTDAGAVAALADAAVARFGTVDTWVNVAGTGVFGPYEAADVALHRRTIEVNLIGAMNGAAAALPVFRRRGRGVLISTVSMGGWSPVPFAPAYTASKFGLRGFNASLRQQFEAHEDIHVCGVFPAMVDTPGLLHVANVSGKRIDPGPLLYTPEDVAAAILRLARHPRGEVAVGWPARAGQMAYAVAPRLTELAVGAVFRRLVRRAGPAPRSEGALRTPVAVGREASGGALARKGLPPAGTLSAAVLAGGLVVVAGVAFAARRRS